MKRDFVSDTELDAQAAEWVVSLHLRSQKSTDPPNPKPGADRNTQFVLWLQQSARHVEAFMRADDQFCRLEGMDPRRQIDLEKLLPPRLSNSTASDTSRKALANARRRAIQKVALAASIIILGSAIFGWLANQHSLVFVTGVGEQRVVKLSDGSTMTLNTSSRATVEFSANVRRVRLEEGEVLFSVEHDTERPFVVLTPNAIVRAVGTQFDVYQRSNTTTTITVFEGTVRFAPMHEFEAAAGSPVAGPSSSIRDVGRSLITDVAAVQGASSTLAAGQQARIVRDKVSTTSDENAPDAIAWRDRLLVFHGKLLAEVAEEFNRYNRTKIRILDTEIGQRRMSGTYSADRPQILALYLREDDSLDVKELGNEWIVRKR